MVLVSRRWHHFGREGYSRFRRGRVCTGRPRPSTLDGAHGLHSGEGRWRKARGYGYPAAKRRRHFAVHARCREGCGVDEIYAVGGAQAIAALAYGTDSIPKTAKIVGPGNAFVAAAKKIVSGDAGIDMVAGPSEVCVLADATADATVVAADLMAQAEHDPLATCYLVTCDAAFAEKVQGRFAELLAASPRAEITSASLADQGVVVVAADLEAAIDAVNVIAPEHLELHCDNAMGLLGKIERPPAHLRGSMELRTLGDYVAGPNHTLPTGGTAAFSNPLSVQDFITRSSVICYTPEGLMNDAPATQTMAQAEGLWAHALSAGLRRKMVEEDLEGFDGVDLGDINRIAWPVDLAAPKRRSSLWLSSPTAFGRSYSRIWRASSPTTRISRRAA